METRREFLTKAALIPGASVLTTLIALIEKAAAIAPDPESTFLDAEHVVVLMQENRSFDHAFGTLRGVRGFNDPRAIKLPNGNPVWMQTNDAGETFVPFRLNLKETNATWMGSLPHSWTDQVDARNGGWLDRWLQAKKSGHSEYTHLPLTLGYYTREDIPFYYALADAFTVCDQNFCSSLTGTTPNRLHLWTGTVRAEQKPDSWANILNSDVTYESEASWTTFPERLEEHGVSWRVYQNEISLSTGLEGEYDAWLSNFTDNPLEWFTQYGVRFAESRRRFLDQSVSKLSGALTRLAKESFNKGTVQNAASTTAELKQQLEEIEEEQRKWSLVNFQRLPVRDRRIHDRAFTTNRNAPDYRELSEFAYRDGDTERRLLVPKGDVLHQFRRDVEAGQLPTVSWLVAPERYSDHPGSAWYGAWYLSEVLEILTRRPEIWKKTIFVLTYDENDGYFDHVPPFVPPHPTKPESGKVSAGIDPAVEYVELQQELTRKPREEARESPIGLGYRVPMIIASPWSRGGAVCSQVFDHTSVLQFLETWLTSRTGKGIRETNISAWRRTVCGDLTSAFRPATLDEPVALPFHERDSMIRDIHRSQFLSRPNAKSVEATTNRDVAGNTSEVVGKVPRQEPGTRPSAPLPYELAIDGQLDPERKQFTIVFEARNNRFGKRSSGAPFTAYARVGGQDLQIRNYALIAGDRLEDTWNLCKFEQGVYDLSVYGPNGFFRKFTGNSQDPPITISIDERVSPPGAIDSSNGIVVRLINRGKREYVVTLVDNSYGKPSVTQKIAANESVLIKADVGGSENWYDFAIGVDEYSQFTKQYAGRVETGEWGASDPAMARGRA
jgi:phospholipase C